MPIVPLKMSEKLIITIIIHTPTLFLGNSCNDEDADADADADADLDPDPDSNSESDVGDVGDVMDGAEVDGDCFVDVGEVDDDADGRDDGRWGARITCLTTRAPAMKYRARWMRPQKSSQSGTDR
jgi:hypothetical protein